MELLNLRGILPTRYVEGQRRKLSPRQIGVRQGAMLMLSTMLVVPIVSVLSVFILGNPEVLVPITALLLFLGGLLRILFALLLEEGAVQQAAVIETYSPPSELSNQRENALPPESAIPAQSWRRPDTAKILPRPSVTENTTRLLEDERGDR